MSSHSGGGSAERSGQNYLGEPVGDLLQTAGDLDVACGVQPQQPGQQVGRMGPRVADGYGSSRQHFVDQQGTSGEFNQIEFIARQRSFGRNQLDASSLATGDNQSAIRAKARFLATICYFDSHVGSLVVTCCPRNCGGRVAGKESFIVGDVGDHAHWQRGLFPFGDQQSLAADLQDNLYPRERIRGNDRREIKRFACPSTTAQDQTNSHKHNGH